MNWIRRIIYRTIFMEQFQDKNNDNYKFLEKIKYKYPIKFKI